MFLWALLLGIWKYRQMALAENHLAHPYVDTAHRAALLYSFALGLVAVFVQLSGWSAAVNLIAAGVLAWYFFASVGRYVQLGIQRDTDNQFRNPMAGLALFMAALIISEVGAWLVLLAGFIDRQIL